MITVSQQVGGATHRKHLLFAERMRGHVALNWGRVVGFGLCAAAWSFLAARAMHAV
jgi:hypothetical protein